MYFFNPTLEHHILPSAFLLTLFFFFFLGPPLASKCAFNLQIQTFKSVASLSVDWSLVLTMLMVIYICLFIHILWIHNCLGDKKLCGLYGWWSTPNINVKKRVNLL